MLAVAVAPEVLHKIICLMIVVVLGDDGGAYTCAAESPSCVAPLVSAPARRFCVKAIDGLLSERSLSSLAHQ